MGLFDIFSRKKKTSEPVSGFKMVHDFRLPLIPFGDNIMKSDVVMICVDRVASQCAKLKGRYVKVDDKGVQTEKSGELSFLLKHKPNELMTPYQFLYKVTSLLLLNNNAFIYSIYDRDSLKLKAIYPLMPTTVEPVEYSDGSHTYKFYFNDGNVYEIPTENVIHLRRFYTKNDFFGGNNAAAEHDALLKTVKINDALLQGIEAGMESSFQVKGILKINGMLKEADKNRQIDEFTRAIKEASTNNSSIIPMDAKAEYTPLEVDPKLVDEPTLKFIQSKILDYFGVSEAIFNNNYDENEYNSFYVSTIEPLAIQLSEAFSLGLLTTNQLERGEEIIFFSERLQYASWNTKVGAIEKLMGLGIMSLNESRNLLGLEPIEGGDKRLQSLNYVDADKANLYQVGNTDNEEENQNG
ncbi:MAG: phage portal protein [Bacilli bacterium]|nr:phage portal protein [Bacilli bacterium]